jgi:hypothetical protein
VKEHPICLDETVDKLEKELAGRKAKPDQRHRWTVRVIERLKVAERAALILINAPRKEWSRFAPEPDEIWHDAQHKAIKQLRREGKIR